MTRRTTKLGILIALVLAFVVGACTLEGPSPSDININNTNTNTITFASVGGSTSDTTKPGCATVTQLKVNYPTNLAVGQQAPLEITPVDANGNKRTAECDQADGVTTATQPTGIVEIEDSHLFVTTLLGKTKGDTSLKIQVGKYQVVSLRITVS